MKWAASSELLRAVKVKDESAQVCKTQKKTQSVQVSSWSYCFSPPWTSYSAGCSVPGSGGSCRTGRRGGTGSAGGNLKKTETVRSDYTTFKTHQLSTGSAGKVAQVHLSRRQTATGSAQELHLYSAPSASHKSAPLSGHSRYNHTHTHQ